MATYALPSKRIIIGVTLRLALALCSCTTLFAHSLSLLVSILTTRTTCVRSYRSNPYPVREVVFNHETTRLTTMCSSQAITWDVGTGQQVRKHELMHIPSHTCMYSCTLVIKHATIGLCRLAFPLILML